MSERRKKRTNKKRDPEVCDVQTGQGANEVPQEVVPQQASEALPQEDTAVGQEEIEQTEVTTMGWRDRLELDRPSIIKMLMAVGISVCIALAIFFTQGVPKGTYNADMTRMEQGITTMGSQIADNTADITDLAGDIATTTEQYSGVANTVAQHTGSITSMGTRLDTAEGDITVIEAALLTVGSPPEGYLTGNFTSGNLTLHAKASYADNHTANVHLVFAPVISAGNATTHDEALAAFYGSVNWAAANVKPYIPVASYNGTDWGISQVWWNIGTFALAADTDTDITVLFGGLNTTPSFAYAAIYPAFK